jgi:hypothetical protein
MWLNAFKLFYVVRCLHEGVQLPEPPKPELEKRSKSMMAPALRNTIGQFHVNNALNGMVNITQEIIKGLSPREKSVPISAR